MTQFKEPYYLVDFNSSICNFDIFINDMPAFNNHVGGGSIITYAYQSFYTRKRYIKH
ncbi:hypothetical protein AB670_04307 [Chryseobacterium sp. MOF25P]|nr:hypothetical protein AB670_04307 [Chryseobacterium sp. MOF25P]OBW45228.1 hypothetical protein AB671_02661 [Chryseobacterium sp. BGARF1]